MKTKIAPAVDSYRGFVAVPQDQAHGMSCAAACLLMLLRWAGDTKATEASCRAKLATTQRGTLRKNFTTALAAENRWASTCLSEAAELRERANVTNGVAGVLMLDWYCVAPNERVLNLKHYIVVLGSQRGKCVYANPDGGRIEAWRWDSLLQAKPVAAWSVVLTLQSK